MPTILRIGPYRFFFFAGDRDEPPHIHVEREDKVAKFWLDPVRLQSSGGFSRNEIIRIQKVVSEYQTQLREGWNAYFHD
jgi:hypothetical protein